MRAVLVVNIEIRTYICTFISEKSDYFVLESQLYFTLNWILRLRVSCNNFAVRTFVSMKKYVASVRGIAWHLFLHAERLCRIYWKCCARKEETDGTDGTLPQSFSFRKNGVRRVRVGSS